MITVVTSTRYRLNKKLIQSKAQSNLDQYIDDPNALVNIIFVGKRKMTEIASTYKHEKVALPVLAFPYLKDPDPAIKGEHLIGEIFLCYPQVILLAAEREKRVDDMMVQLVEHGIHNLFK